MCAVGRVAGGLRGLVGIRPFYEVPRDNIAGELLIPAMATATHVRIMAGFFSSNSFAQLAPGLASFINSDNQPLEFLISPRIGTEDRDALARAVAEPEAVIQSAMNELFDGARASESAIAAHAVDCLAYLVAQGRIEFRFVLMDQGMFHPKVWLFDAANDVVAVHGSSNPTELGLLYNGETVTVERPWLDGSVAEQRVEALVEMFEAYWHNKRESSVTVDLAAGLRVAQDSIDRIPTTDDFWRAWYEDSKRGLAPPLPENVALPVWVGFASQQQLEIPADLIWETGRFGHQGRAVRAWEEHNRHGILAVATGGGKTVVSLIAATRLQNESDAPLLVLILAPTKPLLDQWAAEASRFGVRPYLLGELPADRRLADLQGLVTGLTHGVARTEVIVSSNALFTGSEGLREFIRNLPDQVRVMLVGDEVHNLGTRGFLSDLPNTIPYRLGLSATPARQYDALGTAELFDFFGSTVFEFSLDEAINAGCLTPYHYRLHEVRLSDVEMDEWRRLTEQLRKRGFFDQDEGQTGLDDAIQRLLEARRSVLEHAEEKLQTLESLLRAVPPADIKRTLIYTSAKRDPLRRAKQISEVNRLLNDLGVISHQLTYSETGEAKKARRIIDDFGAGVYQVLTCMKVLDEGVDIPATTHAYILASSTVRREWVQRRGRVLRTSPGKERAFIHDFFVVPPDVDSADGRSILRAELQRADEFARLADNAWDNDGPRAVTERYE